MRLAILLVLLGCGSADAETCTPAGGVILEIHEGATRNAKVSTAKTRIYNNGAWTTAVVDRDGHAQREESGCLASGAIETIRDELREAPWKTTRSAKTCRADQPRFTTYTAKGRLLFTERTCNVDMLDPRSQRAIEVIDVLLSIPHVDRNLDCKGNPLARGCL